MAVDSQAARVVVASSGGHSDPAHGVGGAAAPAAVPPAAYNPDTPYYERDRCAVVVANGLEGYRMGVESRQGGP